ncbi:hypothetical protein MHPYR_530036 [uncultured Mycobacterium sp.]|uniref:Uncharacterized protein n=1 Tax=uncultured Mycobacterium sp. TaxID=171292 RepID=A0A1Y5PLP6_9MYCO|nr:hypothetical protein MHPYR_530036 [uncultured Mycobacterium sp.]
MSGASTATVRPAIARARPNQLAGEVWPPKCWPTVLVRYTEKTNVVTMAFMPVEPQSHNAQDKTLDRPAVWATGGGLVMRATICLPHASPRTRPGQPSRRHRCLPGHR